MDMEGRIKVDLEKFDGLMAELGKILPPETKKKYKKVLELAGQYRDDSEHFLGRKDYFTSFGCIAYAHGLLDALRHAEGIYPEEAK